MRPTALIFNQEAGVSICLIPKVASTTWLGYMAALGRIMNKNICMCLKIFAENISMSRRGDVQGHRLPRPPQGAGLQTAWNSEENLSIVIVRHPYSRLGWLISVVCILKIIRHFSFSQCVLQQVCYGKKLSCLEGGAQQIMSCT